MTTTETPSEQHLYAVRATDRQGGSDVRKATRPAHLEWACSTAVGMRFGGPLRDSENGAVKGSLFILRSTSLSEAEATLEADPYKKAGVFEDVEVRQWVCGMRSDAPFPKQMYMVWCVDKKDALQLRKETREKHLNWWRNANRQGMIGPFPCEGGAVGSLIVCEGDSVEEIRAWADTDPYKVAGLFETVHVCAVTKVMEDGELVPQN